MSTRIMDSQLPDMQERLETLERQNWHLQHQISELRRTDVSIKEVRVVELAYQDKCTNGTEAVNRLLEDGFELHKQFQTESGIIIEVVRWGSTNDEDET